MAEPIGDLQLEVMEIVWDLGDATVAEVHETLSQGRPRAYTTVLTTLRNLEKRGLVAHTREGKAHRFHATVSRDDFTEQSVARLVHRLFAGRPEKLVSHLLGGEQLDPRDLVRIRALLEGKEPNDA